MSRRRSRNRQKQQRQRTNGPHLQPNPDYVAKARVPAGTPMAGATVDRATPLEQLLYEATRTGAFNSHPMARDPYDNANFGPGNALVPAALDPVRIDSGRPEPRGSEYPISWNLRLGGERLIPWQVLRDAADGVDIIRRCIQIRKKHVRGLKWGWTVSADAIQAAYQADPRRGHDDIAAQLRDKYSPQISRLNEFWTNPWRGHLRGLGAWLNMLQEEVIVLDAMPVYPQRDGNGDVHSFRIIDGTTIKPLLNAQGHTPLPPYPAYQQILYGFPRGEYIATPVTDADGHVVLDSRGDPQIEEPFPADELFYWRENPRTFTPYGLSDVEQALISARLYLKRQGWMHSEYDDGSTPVTWLLSEAAGGEMDFRQRRKWQDALNDELSGHTAARQRIKVAPPGFKPQMMANEAERYKPEYDLHLIKLVASHLGVNIAELGFTEAKGLGSSGYHEGQEDVQDRVGRRPDTEMLAEIIECLSREYLEAPPELEFQFTGLESEDEAAADAVADTQVKSGRMTYNEDRRRRGLPLYNFAEADMPILVMQRGALFLEGASELAPPGELITPVQAPPNTMPPEGAEGEPGSADEQDEGADTSGDKTTPNKPEPAGDKPAPKDTAKATEQDRAVADEVTAYRRWARKHPDPKRPFVFAHPEAEQLAKAGDAGPKVPGSVRHWPGWDRDLQTVAVYADRIREALTAAVDMHGLAREWAEQRGMDKAAPAGTGDATGWLAGLGVLDTITSALSVVLADAYAEGWVIGARSAGTLLTLGTIDWGGWTPGDVDAANRVLGADGLGAGLQQLLDDAGVTITSIGQGRLDELAQALALSLEQGDSSDTLARDLHDILDDAKWADLVATTEIARAVSAASMDTYAANGIGATEWLISADQRVCPLCEENADAGPVPLGDAYPSGDTAPPGHPRCRCAPGPVVPEGTDATAATADAGTGEEP